MWAIENHKDAQKAEANRESQHTNKQWAVFKAILSEK